MKYKTYNAEETITLGERFSSLLLKKRIFALHGELGSGKTTFTQGLAKGLGITKPMTSPTFIIMRTYEVPSGTEKTFYHVDLYRTETAHDREGLGITDLLSDPNNLFVIEWSEKMGDALPKDVQHIYFSYKDDDTHEIEITDTDDSIDDSWYVKPEGEFPIRITAGGVVIRKEGENFLVALSHEGAFDAVVLPKGGVDEGETILDAAKRETAEEAGISDLTSLGEIGVRERYTYRKNAWTVQHFFLFVTDQQETNPTETDHVYTTEWVSLDALPMMHWKEQKELLETNKEKIKQLVTAYYER